MIKKYFYLILTIILIIGACLRIINLDKNPPHLGNDEISIAFDSYSVRTTGLDEHGNLWPISFQSHQTFKAPLYAYLNMPINWLLGNNEYGVRLLSAIAGIIIIFLVAMLAKAWSGETVALVAALIMALNPKSIFASRIAFESNLAFMVMSLGILLMYFYRKTDKKIYVLISGLILGLSIWAYHTEWGLAPMLAVFLPWLHRKNFSLKKWWLMWLTLIIVALPIFYNFIVVQKKDNNNRANSQLWLTDGGLQDYLKDSHDNKIKKAATVVMGPVYNYLQHFSLNSLFISGADIFNGESPLESGWFLLATLPLLILGLINIKTVYPKYWDWLLAWWLLSPIVPAMTYGGVASVRNLAFLVPTILIMAGGFKILSEKSKIWTIIISGFFCFNFFVFSLAYYIHIPIDSGTGFQYGYKQALDFIRPNLDKYDKVVVENRFGEFGQFVGVPHLYFAYFDAFPVQDMQKRIDHNGTKIGKFEFKYVDWNQEIDTPKSVYIVSAINPKAGKIAENLQEIGLIRNTDFTPQFLIYETIDN
jgi:4-amino-4-deoxy-L-arabinose transferase-like glycosyltransferase